MLALFATNFINRGIVLAPIPNLSCSAKCPSKRGWTRGRQGDDAFRWLCQMRLRLIAHRQPQAAKSREVDSRIRLTLSWPRVMTIFNLVSFTNNQHLTIRLKPNTTASRTFGDLAASYFIIPKTAATCRLLVKLVVRYPPGAKGLH